MKKSLPKRIARALAVSVFAAFTVGAIVGIVLETVQNFRAHPVGFSVYLGVFVATLAAAIWAIYWSDDPPEPDRPPPDAPHDHVFEGDGPVRRCYCGASLIPAEWSVQIDVSALAKLGEPK